MKRKIFLLMMGLICVPYDIGRAGWSSNPDQEHIVENVQNNPLGKKFISAKFNISIQFPDSWAVIENVMMQYSVAKIRSEDGAGLENVNITVIPLSNKREYSIKDFESKEVPDLAELLESGTTAVANEHAIWKVMYALSANVISSGEVEQLFMAPKAKYRTTDNSSVVYLVQLVRNNHLYTITASALGSSKDRALKRFEENKRLFDEIISTFRFERGKFISSEYGLSIDIPDGWSKYPPSRGQLAAYGKLGSGENFIIRSIESEANLKIDAVTPEQLFRPIYQSVLIEKEASTLIDGQPFKYFIYEIVDSQLKRRQEGPYNLKYLVGAFLHRAQLYTITFTDSVANFEDNYPKFIDTMKSIELG